MKAEEGREVVAVEAGALNRDYRLVNCWKKRRLDEARERKADCV